MCTQAKIPNMETEEKFEDFMRIIMDGALTCDDDDLLELED